MKVHPYRSASTVLVASAIFLASCSGEAVENNTVQKDPVRVTVASATLQDNNTIHASGRIESRQTAVISTRVMGFVTAVHVKAGDSVKKGQALASISSDDLRAKNAQANAMVVEAEAALKDAQRDMERFEQLYQQESASAREFENAALQYNSVKARAEAARQMQKEAESMFVYTNLTAPFAGVVTQKHIDAGSMANPGMPLLILEQEKGYKASVSVSEADIPHIEVGARAGVTIKATGKTIEGRVFEVSPSSQFSGGQYLLGVTIPEDEMEGLYSGMYVTATISSNSRKGDADHAVLVPASSLVHEGQLTGLYTISESGTAMLRWVKAGKAYGDQVEVLSGISPGEQFVVASAGRLYNGAPVSLDSSVTKAQ